MNHSTPRFSSFTLPPSPPILLPSLSLRYLSSLHFCLPLRLFVLVFVCVAVSLRLYFLLFVSITISLLSRSLSFSLSLCLARSLSLSLSFSLSLSLSLSISLSFSLTHFLSFSHVSLGLVKACQTLRKWLQANPK